jgi:hypothetical protein
MVGRSFAGVMLVAIGIALLLIELTGVGGVAVILLGGLAFLATHLATRSYGFLVPGGILTGFGAALVAQDLGLVGDVALVGLGAGFLLIPIVQLLTRAPREGGWWWPVIPGGILLTLGLVELLEDRAAGFVLPGVLIVLGLGFLVGAGRRAPGPIDRGPLDIGPLDAGRLDVGPPLQGGREAGPDPLDPDGPEPR